jgi:integrase
MSYAERRKYGLTKYSIYWIDRAKKDIWESTRGLVSKESIDELHRFVLKKYRSEHSHVKVFGFAKAFLKFLTKARLDTSYYAFEVFLERPRAVKARNFVTSRIITKQDIENVLAYIRNSEENGSIGRWRAQQYTAFVIFGAYTGQRSLATIAKLTAGQFREALQSNKPCIEVLSSQDKIKMQHYVPLHAQVIQAIQPLLDGRSDDEALFEYNSLVMWIKREKIPLTRITSHFVLGDLRKFTEQYGDIIRWDQPNRAYIMMHAVSGIDWKHYKHPLPEPVYEAYIRYWRDVSF